MMQMPASRAASMAQRILVVDDEKDIRRVLRRILEARGYHVTEAGSAEEALALASQDSALALKAYARAHGQYTVAELLPEARRQLAQAEALVRAQMQRNVFITVLTKEPE